MNFFYDLFVLDGLSEEAAASYAFLPFVVTALAVGVLIASVYFIVWRILEADMVKRLYESNATSAQDGKTLSDLGYKSGSLRERLMLFLLRSQSCIIYKTVSCDALDAHKLALMKQAGEVADVPDDAPDVSEPQTEEPTPATSDLQHEETPSDTSLNLVPNASEEEDVAEQAPTQKKKQKRLRERARLKATSDTHFYILPTQLEYVEQHAMKFSKDDIWGFVFTCAATVVIWLAAMALLDPLMKLLTK